MLSGDNLHAATKLLAQLHRSARRSNPMQLGRQARPLSARTNRPPVFIRGIRHQLDRIATHSHVSHNLGDQILKDLLQLSHPHMHAHRVTWGTATVLPLRHNILGRANQPRENVLRQTQGFAAGTPLNRLDHAHWLPPLVTLTVAHRFARLNPSGLVLAATMMVVPALLRVHTPPSLPAMWPAMRAASG